MRVLPIPCAVLLAAATPAFAQVTVDLHALQALPERPAGREPIRPRPQAAPSPQASPSTRAVPGPTVVTRVAPVVVSPGAPSPATPPTTPPLAETPAPQPAMPETVPRTAAITPIAPAEPSAGAPPPPVSDTAATKAAPTTAGLRLTFAPDQSALSPDGADSIKQLAASAPPGEETTFNVQAYAPGKADDPSTARRVSLSRAMAVRSALVANGVPSARIFVRALGEQYGDGPPDRVDIAVTAPLGSAVSR